MDSIHIKNLRLRTIIGVNDWEREAKQDIVLNIRFNYDAQKAKETDDIKNTVDYKALTKEIISFVENSEYFLLERLANEIMKIIWKNIDILQATVRIDKPFALRFSDSVIFETTKIRS